MLFFRDDPDATDSRRIKSCVRSRNAVVPSSGARGAGDLRWSTRGMSPASGLLLPAEDRGRPSGERGRPPGECGRVGSARGVLLADALVTGAAARVGVVGAGARGTGA